MSTLTNRKHQYKSLINALGWRDIESANPYILSFMNEDSGKRLNYYFTTGTVTIDRKETGQCEVHRNISLDDLEKVLNKTT